MKKCLNIVLGQKWQHCLSHMIILAETPSSPFQVNCWQERLNRCASIQCCHGDQHGVWMWRRFLCVLLKIRWRPSLTYKRQAFFWQGGVMADLQAAFHLRTETRASDIHTAVFTASRGYKCELWPPPRIMTLLIGQIKPQKQMMSVSGHSWGIVCLYLQHNGLWPLHNKRQSAAGDTHDHTLTHAPCQGFLQHLQDLCQNVLKYAARLT